MHEIMTIEDVAKYLRVSERTVYDWAQKGILPGGKIGTTWRFKSADIQKWVNDKLNNDSLRIKKLILNFIVHYLLRESSLKINIQKIMH